MRIPTLFLLLLLAACASVPEPGSELSPECAKRLLESRVPHPWDVQLYELEEVALFTVEYGAAQDCPSGCFNSNGFGLMWTCSDVKWLYVNDYDGVEFASGSVVTSSDLQDLGGEDFVNRVVARYPHLEHHLKRALKRLEREPG